MKFSINSGTYSFILLFPDLHNFKTVSNAKSLTSCESDNKPLLPSKNGIKNSKIDFVLVDALELVSNNRVNLVANDLVKLVPSFSHTFLDIIHNPETHGPYIVKFRLILVQLYHLQ